MKTTLKKIRAHRPCATGWEKLLRTLNKTSSDNEPVSIIQILDSNGLDDALWCLRAVNGHDREIRLFAVWCARRVKHLMADQRNVEVINVSERHANGLATDEELRAAAEAASAAVSVAAGKARAALRAAEGVAAPSAARAAVWAAEGAAWAVEGAAWDAEVAAQEAELRRICEEATQ